MVTDWFVPLAGRDVQVWTLRINASPAAAQNFDSILTAEERERASRFRFDHLRHSFSITRGVLRYLLGRHLGISPADVQLHYGGKGKPAIDSGADIEFNLAHSGDLAVFAFTSGCPLGVDVECTRPLPDAESIANRFFCPEETAELMALPAGERERAFFLCWTRKEAYIKAIGDGLSTPLDEFRVTLQPAEPARFIHLTHDENAAKEWALHDLQLATGYAGALAYRDAPRPVKVFPVMDSTEFEQLL